MSRNTLIVKAQMTSFKSLATGGWRLTVDLFESELKDILAVTAMVNDQSVVEVELKIEVME